MHARLEKRSALRAAQLVLQKSFDGAAGKEERFRKDIDQQVLAGYGIAAFDGVSKNSYIEGARVGIAGKGAALSFYCRPCSRQHIFGCAGKRNGKLTRHGYKDTTSRT